MGDPSRTPITEAEFYFRQGEAEQRLGNLDVAISCFEECVKIGHPYFVGMSLLRLALIYKMSGQKEKERETWNRIYDLPEGEKKFIPHSVLAVILVKLGKFKEARAYFSEAMKLKPRDVINALNFAELEIILGHVENAESLLATFDVSSDPKILIMSRFFRVFIALLEGRGNEITRSLSTFIEVVKKIGMPADLHWDLSELLSTLNKVEDENNSQIARKLVALLNREISVEDFLGFFSAVPT